MLTKALGQLKGLVVNWGRFPGGPEMISVSQLRQAQKKTLGYFKKAGIHLTAAERVKIEVADFGLSSLKDTGLELLTYLNTQRCCAKELVLFPGQTCPEHRHPAHGGQPGKEETFRCRWGTVYLYVPGPKTPKPKLAPPEAPAGAYTVFHEVVLKPGDQYTLAPGTKHWFRSGPQGAIVSEFSTRSRDDLDIFSDERIQRMTKVAN
jgi:D-lyxose ketol-isomerase